MAYKKRAPKFTRRNRAKQYRSQNKAVLKGAETSAVARQPTLTTNWQNYVPNTNTIASIGALAAMGYAGYQTLKTDLNTEVKWFDDLETTPQPVQTTLTSMTNMGEGLSIGDSTNNRDGDQVKVRSYYQTIKIDNEENAVIQARFRVIRVLQYFCNADKIASNDLLQVNTNILSPYGMSFEGYKVLSDQIFTLDGASGNGFNPTSKIIKYVYTPKTHHLKWTSGDTTGAIANLNKGLLRTFIMVDTIATTAPNYTYYERLRFIDN